MPAASASQPQTQQQDAGAIVELGGWLFRRRSAIPAPLALLLLLLPPRAGRGSISTLLTVAGLLAVAGGEALRLWAVRHIGAVSRTRSDRLGPLVSTGPFALIRNPLYAGNILLWVGLALAARLPWMAVIVALVLGVEYHAIIRWEERLLEARRGVEYRDYLARVPRWLPRRLAPGASRAPAAPFSWRETLFSERSTLIGIALGLALLALKNLIIG